MLIMANIDILELLDVDEKQITVIPLSSAAQLDPIQRLFLDKIREYSTKSQYETHSINQIALKHSNIDSHILNTAFFTFNPVCVVHIEPLMVS